MELINWKIRKQTNGQEDSQTIRNKKIVENKTNKYRQGDKWKKVWCITKYDIIYEYNTAINGTSKSF